jgi:hypothetical protein
MILAISALALVAAASSGALAGKRPDAEQERCSKESFALRR